MQQQTSAAKELNLIQKQQKTTEELLDRLARLEVTVSTVEGELAAVRTVNTILSQQLDEANQYSQRSCMIVTGLQKPGKDEMNDKDSKRVIFSNHRRSRAGQRRIHEAQVTRKITSNQKLSNSPPTVLRKRFF